jgi:hypothetical protein
LAKIGAMSVERAMDGKTAPRMERSRDGDMKFLDDGRKCAAVQRTEKRVRA